MWRKILRMLGVLLALALMLSMARGYYRLVDEKAGLETANEILLDEGNRLEILNRLLGEENARLKSNAEDQPERSGKSP
ncbi:hypothetical protein [Pseudomonas schmalbachii]|uniref:Cell division protein FtsL n=1 Tax=Pseudomonas schmalbachii TaxID=2816993 RepID=A0ABS3TUI0_9PSED|nr:hypothetical protein [Pseudomonas schmalbachii]MBO3277314.1 hypothetical protein [Pseudomonas schmalbachii]